MKNKRLSALVVAGLFLVVSGASYLYFFRSRPIGTGPAGPELSAEMFSGVWSDKPVLLVGLGDSVTAGFGARRGYSYFNLLVTNSATEFQDMRGKCLQAVLPNLIFTNLSESGSTSGEHLRRQLPRLPVVGSNTTALVVITTGGNDLIHNYGRTPPREEAMYGATWEQAEPWIKNFEQRLNEMIGVINDHYSAGCEIFLANIFDPTDAVGDIQRAGLPSWKDGIKILTAFNDVPRIITPCIWWICIKHFWGTGFIAHSFGRSITEAMTRVIGITLTWRIQTSAAMMRSEDCF